MSRGIKIIDGYSHVEIDFKISSYKDFYREKYQDKFYSFFSHFSQAQYLSNFLFHRSFYVWIIACSNFSIW